MIKKSLAVATILATLLPLQPAAVLVASRSRTAFWVRDGKVFVGHAVEREGKIKLTRFSQWEPPAVDGAVLSVTWSPDGNGISWYDSGSERHSVVVNDTAWEFGNPDYVLTPADEVEDRGGWMWARKGQARLGPLAMFDRASDASTPEAWRLLKARWEGDGGGESYPRKFKASGRDVSRFVTAVMPGRVEGGVVAIRPYTVRNGERVYKPAYLARVTNSLAVGRRVGGTLPVFHMAFSAGNTRVALVTGSQRRVQIRSFPGLSLIESYPGMRRAHVSLSPDGFLAISGPKETIIRDADGTLLEVPEGITWFAYAPCSGKGCGELA